MNDTNRLTHKDIFIFWLPLLATLIMMMIEAPLIASVIARLPNPKYNLAAFGVAYSIAMFFESPIIMILSASTALAKDKHSFVVLRNFTYFLNGIITILLLFTLVPPIFQFLVKGLIGLPDEVSSITYVACFILIFWPAAIGYRRFYQGILIRNNFTRRVGYGTVIRVCSMTLTALFFYAHVRIEGAYVGAIALSVGVFAEAIASRLMARKLVHQLQQCHIHVDKEKPLSYRRVMDFYAPLAASSVLALGIRPLVTFFMGKSLLPIESLAVYPVIYGLVGIFYTFGWSFQEASIALIGEHLKNLGKLMYFALVLGLFAAGALSIIAFTPLSVVWFHKITGLSLGLTHFSIRPTQFISIIPFLHVLVSFFIASLIAARVTNPIIKSTAVEVGVITLTLFIGIHHLSMVGIVAAVMAHLFGRFSSLAYLSLPLFKALRTKDRW